MSNVRFASSVVAPTRYRSTSRTAIGWIRLCTHRGVTMTGSRSVRYRSISNDADPEPMITAACSTTAGTPDRRKTSPTSLRDARCGDSATPAGCSPPR